MEAEKLKKSSDIDRRLEEYTRTYNTKVDEMANTKPETFWGSKNIGEKIGLAIALAMGSFGSSMTGGPNTALQVINGQMTSFANQQRAIRDKQMAALDRYKGKITDMEAKKNQVEMNFQAKIGAMYKRVDMQLAGAQAKAKSENQKGTLEQMRGQILQDSAQAQAQMLEAFAPSVTKSVTEDQTQGVAPGAEGQFKSTTDLGDPLTGEQLKKLGFLSKSVPALEAAEKFEQSLDDAQIKTLQGVIGAIDRKAAAENIPYVGGIISATRELPGGWTPEEILLESGIPGALEYYDNLLVARDALLRDESGAALAGTELERKKRLLFPSKVSDRTNLKAKQVTRRNELIGLREGVGQRSVPFWWEKKKGK